MQPPGLEKRGMLRGPLPAVRHEPCRQLDRGAVARMIGHPPATIDCFGILDDHRIRCYFGLGCEVKGLGRGHVKRIKDSVRH